MEKLVEHFHRAVLSIITALILHECWATAIVVLMLSGGKALEQYATRRALTMLSATAGIALRVNNEVTSKAVGAVILQSSLASEDELIPHRKLYATNRPHQRYRWNGVESCGHGGSCRRIPQPNTTSGVAGGYRSTGHT